MVMLALDLCSHSNPNSLMDLTAYMWTYTLVNPGVSQPKQQTKGWVDANSRLSSVGRRNPTCPNHMIQKNRAYIKSELTKTKQQRITCTSSANDCRY